MEVGTRLMKALLIHLPREKRHAGEASGIILIRLTIPFAHGMQCREYYSSIQVSHLPAAMDIPPASYRFPIVPQHIRAELTSLKDGLPSVRLKSDIVNWLFYDLSRYTLFPGKLYSVCAQHLVCKYPKLKDNTKTGYGTWVMSLRYKAKNTRRRLPPGNPVLEDARQKAKKQCTPSSSASPFHRAGNANGMDELGDGEDEGTIEVHLNILNKEMRKTVPDMEKVSLSMDRTFTFRKRWLREEKPLVAEVLEKYPPLRSEEQVYMLTSLPTLAPSAKL
ncbi:uncharacterized protein LOC135387360 [Ornithodoros turicata]|uniref:uncharacterized protein LOC135387360 n=1 Tax=Ornithodoros turicata TaxID=34597 RepID=UPI003138952B